ncbi:hypothetical protein D3C81_1185740 [compost metagenome]
MFERAALGRVEAAVIADDLRHAANADAILEARDGDLVGFIQHRRHRAARGVDQRHRDREALERVHRQVGHARQERLHQLRRPAAQRHDHQVGDHRLAVDDGAGDGIALRHQAVDRAVVQEPDAQRLGQLRKPRGEQLAVAGFIVGKAQAAAQLVADSGQRRFARGEFFARKQLVGHAGFFQHGDVLGRALQLLVGAEHLQRALLAAFICDAGFRAQCADAVAAVFGQPHHALLVHGIALGAAVQQHLPHPLQLEQRAVRTDGQGSVFLEHPLDRLQRHAGRGPRRGIARGDLPRVGKAGAKRGPGLAIDDGHFVTGPGQIPRTGDANDATAKYENAHFGGSQLRCQVEEGFVSILLNTIQS